MSTPHLSPRDPEAINDRRSRILASGSRAFAASGFRGASLRDIATGAEVSLTLVDHHFGSKEQLLAAVIANHHEICKKRMIGLRTALLVDGHASTLAQLTATWVHHEFELCSSEEGAEYFRLQITLMNDEHLPASVRETLDCSEPVVLHALKLAAPNATHVERGSAFIFARGALHAAIIGCSMASETGLAVEAGIAADSSTSFIHGGLAALLR